MILLGGELVVELVADVLELLLALPFLPNDSSSVCVASCPLEEPLFLEEAGAGGVAWVQRFFAGGGVSSLSLSLLFTLPSMALSWLAKSSSLASSSQLSSQTF